MFVVQGFCSRGKQVFGLSASLFLLCSVPFAHAFDLIDDDESGWLRSAATPAGGDSASDTANWWGDRWGLKGSLYSDRDLLSATGEPEQGSSIGLTQRLYSFTNNTFISMGVGWNSLALDDTTDGAGMRFSVGGQWGLSRAWSLYGQTTWFPQFDDGDQNTGVQGNGIEAGISYAPLPNFSLRAGYRRFTIDFSDEINGDDTTSSSGVMLGAGIRF